MGCLAEAFEAERRGANGQAARANDLSNLDVLRHLGVELRPFSLPEHADMDALQMLLVDEAAAFDELIQIGRIDLLIQDRDEPEDMLMRVARGPNTSANNLTGHPGVSVPNGFAPDGTPTGILFIGQLCGEADMLRLAKAYQDATDFHLRRPSLQKRATS